MSNQASPVNISIDYCRCRKKLNLDEIRPDDIVNCHRLQKSTAIHRPMVIRFASQRVRAEILNELRRLYTQNIYINEHLIRNVSGMFNSARKMLRDKLIAGAWTRGYRPYIKTRKHDIPPWSTLRRIWTDFAIN